MNIVLIFAGGRASTCVVRDDGSAFQLEDFAFPHGPFKGSPPSEQLIRLLARVLRQTVGDRRAAPSRLVAYVPPSADCALATRVEACAFAAGFDQVRLLTLAEIASSISLTSLRGRVLAIDASADEVSALDFEVLPDGTHKANSALATNFGLASLQSAVLSLFREESADKFVSAHPDVLQELAFKWGKTSTPAWILEARRWTLEGWRAVCISGEAAERLDHRILAELRPIADAWGDSAFQAVVVLGEMASGIARLVGGRKSVRLSPSKVMTASVLEGAVRWVRDRRPPPMPGVAWTSDVHVLLDLETARSIGAEESKLPRNPARVPLVLDQRLVIAQVPVMAYDGGIQLQIDYDSDVRPIAVLGGAIRRSKRPSLGIDLIAKRLPDGGLLVRADCAEENARAVLLVRPRVEPVVLEFEHRRPSERLPVS